MASTGLMIAGAMMSTWIGREVLGQFVIDTSRVITTNVEAILLHENPNVDKVLIELDIDAVLYMIEQSLSKCEKDLPTQWKPVLDSLTGVQKQLIKIRKKLDDHKKTYWSWVSQPSCKRELKDLEQTMRKLKDRCVLASQLAFLITKSKE